METRVAVMSIIVENQDSVERLNVCSTITENISSGGWGFLTVRRRSTFYRSPWTHLRTPSPPWPGKLGNLKGVSVKTAYSHVTGQENEA